MSETPNYVIGIDLGTTNTALGFVDAQVDEDTIPAPALMKLQQLVKPGDVQPRDSLPSFLYLTESGELPEGAADLPWASGRDFMVGEAARERGAQVPLRLVHSSKSWLCHAGVDRRAPILPHKAPAGVTQVSPVAAAVRYLEHLKDAWDHENPKHKLESQQIFLTVPASFDAVARDLTIEAAQKTGLTDVTLLEEPQAAFYAWLAQMGDNWRNVLKPGSRVLVCDVGGGTSDFSLIEVKDDGAGNLGLERVAVGDHILLGGDNMDLALAHHLMGKLAKDKKKLNAGQQRALIQGARRAKEALLSNPALESSPITLLGRGSKLIGGKIKTELLRAEMESLLVEGFFPKCGKDDAPKTAKRTGFMELGLPFVSDAAITRHLAAFIKNQGEGKQPTHILFNGGVFNSALLRDRLLSIMSDWGDAAPQVLQGGDNDLAVAKGAAHYGAIKKKGGLRIRGGVARSYYVGIEKAVPAVPGIEPPINAMCVVPFGMEEGSHVQVPGSELGLVIGEQVEFRFLSSSASKNDRPGDVLDEYAWPEVLTETAPISAKLDAEGLEAGTVVPVRLEAHLTEIGTLELWSVRTDGSQRWRLEFNVREQEQTEQES